MLKENKFNNIFKDDFLYSTFFPLGSKINRYRDIRSINESPNCVLSNKVTVCRL